jgi:large subunit ribosomal protein L7/L12
LELSFQKKEIQMADLDKIMEQLSELTVMEAAELVNMLEEEWGVSAAAPVAMAAAAPGADAGEAAEAKSEFDVVIKETGPKKIEVIKAIRALTSLGLKDAKELAETAGAKVMEGVGKDAAEDAQKQLEEAGATVELA